jgi:hypothetical protein
LAGDLLWFDAVGASQLGITTLPRWLERIGAGEFNAAAEGKVMVERNGTAVLDGQNGLPPHVLERAAGIAADKASEAGVGLARVNQIGPMGPAAGVATELVIEPFAAVIVGPGPSWSLACPADEGLPAVFDSALDGGSPAETRREPLKGAGARVPWAEVVAPQWGWLVAAVTIEDWESLPSFHEWVKRALADGAAHAGLLGPDVWAARRCSVREFGVPRARAVWNDLINWAERVGLTPLGPDLR